MELADRLAENLTIFRQQNPNLAGWRFDLSEVRGIEVGLKNNRIGGPYSAPSYKRSISGELYLIWENNHFTSAKLDSNVVESFKEYMNLWQTTAYFDPDGVGLNTPVRVPEIRLEDVRVKEVIDREYQLPFELLKQGLERLQASGAGKIDGKVRCYKSKRVLINSEGFRLAYPQTPMDFFFEANDSYGEAYREKRWPTQPEIDRVIENTGRITKYLAKDAPNKLSGKIRLLFVPSIFESFLNQFLLTNLYGSLVINRQSRFSLEDFQNQHQVMRNDLSLEVNTLLPYRSFSYPCTSEGVPGGEISYIKAGKLQTPILNLKYARKAGMKPTPIPSGGFFLKTNQPLLSWDELISRTDLGMIVYSVLGLHTQDTSSGQFSLTADQCLLVEQGKIIGKIKGVINGDFLGSLIAEESKLGFVEGEDNPGYSFWATVAG